MKVEKVLYFLIFVISIFLALTTFYIEIKILSSMEQFETPVYHLSQYNLKLKGNPAALAHLINIVFGVLALVVAKISYKNLKK